MQFTGTLACGMHGTTDMPTLEALCTALAIIEVFQDSYSHDKFNIKPQVKFGIHSGLLLLMTISTLSIACIPISTSVAINLHVFLLFYFIRFGFWWSSWSTNTTISYIGKNC